MNANSEASPRLLTAVEMAEMLAVPVSWIYGKTSSGEIPHVKVGRYVRFKAGEVLRWVEHRGDEE